MADLRTLTVAEARAILLADEALDATYEARLASGQTFGIEELDAWRTLVESATARIAAYERSAGAPTEVASADPYLSPMPYPGGNEPDFQTLFVEAVAASEQGVARAGKRAGYTVKRLTDADAAEVAELLRVSLMDEHWRAWSPRLREIREKMIARLGDEGTST